MRKLTEQDEVKKPRTVRLTDKTWANFAKLKDRDKTWELFFEELLKGINFFKDL